MHPHSRSVLLGIAGASFIAAVLAWHLLGDHPAFFLPVLAVLMAAPVLACLVFLGRPADTARQAWRLLESSPIAVVINRPDGTPLFANTRAHDLAGTDAAGFMARPVMSWFGDPDFPQAALERLRAGERLHDMEVEFQTVRGDSFWTLTSMESLDLDGRPAIISWSYDITARKTAEQELRKLSLAVEQSPSMLLVTDPDGRIQYANPCYCRTAGLTAAELVGQPPDLVDLTDAPLRFSAPRHPELKDGGVWLQECRLRTAHPRTQWVRVMVSPLIEDATIRHCIWVLEDLSLHRDAMEALDQAKRLAEEAAASRARFLADMSHEIRTPANAIVGLTHLALDSGLPPAQLDHLTRIQSAADTLLAVINDVLDLSKIDAGRLSLEQAPFSLDEMIDRVITLVAPAAHARHLALLLAIAPDVPLRPVGDALRLGQVLTNLLANAVKFTERGFVRLNVVVAARDETSASLHFEVEDTGIGLPPGEVEHLFEAFSQADDSVTRRFGGTGLGLAISNHLVTLMGGRIEVRSAPGDGSRFGFTVRLGVAPAPAAVELPSALRGAHTLVIDPHTAARDLLVAQLNALGVPTEGCDTPDAALAWAHDPDRSIRLVLAAAPRGESGPSLTAALHTLAGHGPLPALVIMGPFPAHRNHAGLPAGHLRIPATRSRLRDAVVEALAPTRPEPHELPAPPPRALAGRSILVAEDVEINRTITQNFLENAGARVTLANDGDEALRLLQTMGAQAFDAVLMDIQMPVLDGLSATRQLRADSRFAHLPVIAMTAHAMADDRDRCLQAGMTDHVAKPIAPERLIDVLIRHTMRAPQPAPAAGPQPAAVSHPSDLPHIAGIDVPGALPRFNHNVDMYLRILRRFAPHHGDAPARIEAALAAGQRDDAERIAHTLRSSAAGLGADGIADLAAQIELGLRKGAGIDTPLHGLHEEMTRLLAALDRALPPEEAPRPGAPELDAESLDAACRELDALLRHADGRAPALFLRIRNDLSRRHAPAAVETLADAIARYDYDKALIHLANVMNRAPAP